MKNISRYIPDADVAAMTGINISFSKSGEHLYFTANLTVSDPDFGSNPVTVNGRVVDFISGGDATSLNSLLQSLLTAAVAAVELEE